MIRVTIQLPNDHNLFLFGDDHEGTLLRHNEGWLQMCDLMNGEYEGCGNNFGIDHGDIVEFIPSKDKRWHGETVTSLPLKQIKNAVKHREPIKDKLLWILDGNHPWKYHYIGNATEQVCDELGVRYGTWTVHATYVNRAGNLLYRHFATHGRKSISSRSNRPIKRQANEKDMLRDRLENKFGDCILMSRGHTHKLIVSEPVKELYLTGDDRISQNYTESEQTASYIHPDHRWYVSTGCFHMLYREGVNSYAEMGDYDPMELGFAIVRVRDKAIRGIDKFILSGIKHDCDTEILAA